MARMQTGQAERLVKLAMPAALAAARMAFDRASVRQVDSFGHMGVQVVNLSAAGVSSYQSEEVPGWQALGLRSGATVRLLRPPEELARAASSLCGKPVLLVHKPVSAEDHPHRLVVGSVGGDVRFENPWLRGSLTLWDAEAISLVEGGLQRSVSCGYSYIPVLGSGSYQGARYDGKMTELLFNHLAIVEAPRVPGCVIGDAALQQRGTKMAKARPPGISRDDEPELDDGVASQLRSYLTELLTSDQLADIETILGGGTAENPAMASDAAARHIARVVVAEHRVRQSAALRERFPDFGRLR